MAAKLSILHWAHHPDFVRGFVGLLAIALLPHFTNAQAVSVGEIAPNFTLKDRRTGEDVSLHDFEGKIVVLDFFAYWCAPCAFSSPDLEENIQQFYAAQGGNSGDVPVQVVAINIEDQDPTLTDTFIANVGMEIVVDDPVAAAWNIFNRTNGIPLFAVINGVADSPSHAQWEVLHNAASYPGSDFLRELIDSVQPGPSDPTPDPTEPVVDPLDKATDIGDNWRWIPWFGRYKITDTQWVYHEANEWLYLGQGNLESGQLIATESGEWRWTKRTLFPRYYSLADGAWRMFRTAEIDEVPDVPTTPPDPPQFPISDNTSLFLNFARDYNSFDVSFTTIPVNEIRSGGPPRDGIPAIRNPLFLPINQVGYLEDSDILVSVTLDNITRAYPFRILNWHEVANDSIGEHDFVVTYCPLCGTAFVFDAQVDGQTRNFGVSGLLYQNNLLMYDQETESLWSQFALRAVSGDAINKRLQWMFSEQMTWSDWKTKYPNGEVLSTDTGFDRDYTRDPYAQYFLSDAPLFPTSRPIRNDLPAKDWIWGITVGDVAKAYPLDRLVDGQPVLDTIDGVQLSLTLDAEARSVLVINTATDTPHDSGVGSFWFSWQDFYPDTLVYVIP